MLISRMTNDVEALDSLVTDTVVTLFQASLTLIGSVGDPALPRRRAGAADLPHLPGDGDRVAGLPHRQRRRLPAHARDDQRDHPSTCRRRCRASASCAPSRRSRATAPTSPRSTTSTAMPTSSRSTSTRPTSPPSSSSRPSPPSASSSSAGARRSTATSRSACSSASSPRSTASSTRSASSRRSTRPTSRAWRRSTRSSSCSTSRPSSPTGPTRHRARRASAARSASRTSPSATAPRKRTKLALDDVSLTVPPGQTVALVGATGAGKSTFAKLVARFYDPTDGRVLVDGHDLRDVAAHSLRSQMGIVPQEAFLFSGTIADNIALRAPRRDRGRRSRPPRGRWARGTSSPRCRPRASTPRSASAACSSPPASASSSRSPARSSPTRGSSSSTRRPRTSTCTPRGASRRAATAAGRAHGDRHRPPAVDHPPVRADRRARPGADRRAGHPRRAHRRRRRVRRALRRLGGAGRGVTKYALRAAGGRRRRADGGCDESRASRRTAAFAPAGWTPPSAADEIERLRGLLGADPEVWYLVAEPTASSSATSGSCRPIALIVPVDEPHARALPPALRDAGLLGHRPGDDGCTPRRSRRPRRAASPRCGCSRRPAQAARAALLRARGMDARAPARVRASASASRSPNTAPLWRYSSRPRRMASATAAARSLTPSFS